MRILSRAVFLAVFLIPLWLFQTCKNAEATLLRKFTLETLSTTANSIVIGKIVDLKSRMESGEVWTIVTVRVEKTLKGGASQTILFRVPGGITKIGEKTLVTRVEGLPDFTHMERAVLFLEGKSPSYPTLLGYEQGYWKITHSQGQEVASAPSFDAIPLHLLERTITKTVKAK